jgi:drug/metabolite transporter (DMT)-like permease
METLQKNQGLGIILVLLSGLFYGTNPTLGKLHFQEGGDTLSFLIVRFFVATIILLGVYFWRRPTTKPTMKQVIMAFILGLSIFAISFLYVAAIQFIPAGLGTLLLFTFPFWIVLLAFVTKEEPIDKIKIGCLIAAFLGLALTIGAELKGLAWEGVLLGLCSAIILALNVFYGNRLTKNMDNQTFTLLMMISCAIVCFPIMLIDTPTFPHSFLGWSNVFLAAILFSGGLFCFFAGMTHLGPIKASLYNNIEPVFSIVLAFLILNEKMAFYQYIGAGLVIVSIFAIQIIKPKVQQEG